MTGVTGSDLRLQIWWYSSSSHLQT